MRWNEIINEELSVVEKAKSYIMDVLASLESQGINKISVQQMIDQLKNNPEMENVQIEAGMINQALSNVKDVQVTPDPETGKMSIIINMPEAGRQVDRKQAEKEENNIRKAALRALDNKDKE